jgi:hypothetical protein
LASGQANGKLVHLKSSTAVTVSGNSQIGTVPSPVAMVIDTPDGSTNTWNMKGTADFHGILVTVGDSTLTRTSRIHGALYCSGTITNKGNGSCAEIN